ncbi:MAG: hypothetical protein E7352_06695 [Clostridiales bacterium]|nr:hypothetical protein [Clostridiales bacterium]
MKKTKILSLALAALLSIGSVGAVTGCAHGDSTGGGNNGPTETIDTSRTQLYVRNYQGGFGNKWLHNGKEKFEKKYEGISLEPGKTGLQVLITDKKETPNIANIKNDIYEVYFVEKIQYLYLVNQGVVADMTDAVTKENAFETGKTIESKLTDEQKAFYGIQKDGETRYYALPHYVAMQGIVYDMDLFDERGYYFIDGYETQTDLPNKFIYDEGDKKSAGPDGTYETDDDGLPATYDDFWDLCEYIYQDGYTPLNWGGKGGEFYITALMTQLMADYQGKDQFMMNSTLEGVMNDMIKIENGAIVFDEDGNPVMESVELDPEKNNGYETFRNASYYYALGFVHKLIRNMYRYSDATKTDTTSYTAFDAQDDYVQSRHATKAKRMAMLIEGSWWDSETTDTFNDMVTTYGEKAKKENCRYGWLPLPKANAAQVEKKIKNTMLNTIDALCFVKEGIADWKEELAMEFVQLMHTDEAFVDFTVQTNAYKDFKYSIDEETVAKLSPFGQEMYKDWVSYDIVSFNHNNPQYYETTYMTSASRRYGISTTDTFPSLVFAANAAMTPEVYFVKTLSYVRKSNARWN